MKARKRVVGHGELLKALNDLPGVTDQRFRIAVLHLAHAKPPEYRVFVKTRTMADLIGCTSRSIELCRAWLKDADVVRITRGGGRGRLTTVDFAPLAQAINPEGIFGVSAGKTPKPRTETPKAQTETPKLCAPYKEEGPLRRTHKKDGVAKDADVDRVKDIRNAIKAGEPHFRIKAGYCLSDAEYDAIAAAVTTEKDPVLEAQR